MGNRKAPSPPPGSPGYTGQMQFKPAPPPPPPAKRGITVTIENSHLMYDAIRDLEKSSVAAFSEAIQKVIAKQTSGRPKGKKR